MHHLVNCIHRRVCCYSNGESPCHHSFHKEQKPSHSQHVLGYKLNRGGHVGWSPIRGLSYICSPIGMPPYKTEFISGSFFLLRTFPLFFPFVSLTNIAVISLERFHATFRPFRHRLIKRWVYVVAIVVVWVFPVIVLVIWRVELLYFYGYHVYIVESYCLLCLTVTFVSYTSILFKFRFGTHPQRHCAAALRQRKLTVTLFITTLVSLLLWLPYNIFLILHWSNDI